MKKWTIEDSKELYNIKGWELLTLVSTNLDTFTLLRARITGS